MPEAPFYRLHGSRRSGFRVDVVLGGHNVADGFDPDDSWGWTARTREVAATLTRDSALAVLRLHTVEAYQDWTEAGPRKGWDSPLTPL